MRSKGEGEGERAQRRGAWIDGIDEILGDDVGSLCDQFKASRSPAASSSRL